MIVSQVVATGLSFIHIPKNAGTSVKQAIADNRLPILVTGHPYPRKLSTEEFVVLRSPVSRFVSAFYYGQKYWPSRINVQFADANELASSAANPDHPKHALAWIELGNRPEHFIARNGKPVEQHTVASRVTDFSWIYEPQSSWLINSPVHVLRYRHLSRDFAALLEKVGLPRDCELPRSNQSDGREEQLSSDALAFLERTYAADFEYIRSRGLDV